MNYPPPLPEDWLEAERHGAPIYGVLPCKTPLQGHAVPAAYAWTPTHAVAAAVASFGAHPAAVVDLTSGAGFYNRTASPWGSAAYHVIPCQSAANRGSGRDDAPTEEAWHAFYLALKTAKDAHGRVVVHCRHGFNRTGFMVCRYAVVAGEAADCRTAVAAFAAARPPGIYKAAYLAALFAALGEAPLTHAPPWPPWRQARRVLDSLPAVWRDAFGNGPTPLPFPSGLVLPPTNAHDVGALVQWSCRTADASARLSAACVVRSVIAAACGCADDAFGGPQPVALRRGALASLRAGYAVTWKADGVRLLVAVLPFGTFGLNRRMEARSAVEPLRQRLPRTSIRGDGRGK